jgi:hypothetical protein
LVTFDAGETCIENGVRGRIIFAEQNRTVSGAMQPALQATNPSEEARYTVRAPRGWYFEATLPG